VRAVNPLFGTENLGRIAPLLDLLRDVAAGHQVAPAQIALAWLVRLPRLVVIPGASSVAQLEANAAAGEVSLTDAEHTALTDAARAFVPVSAARTVIDAIRKRIGR
jgi:aryl-alcohol dehydrogenase-like predicted oxidoreductase